ncbi:hypothetical protein O7632_08885 [Solwaraspora sp. WMMD406]|uniref:hypothetical protein n=1 Tax=Solwaraspora sp. WMMD406 TaxID=3016095 RepID=UPI002417ED88|nr:hypothetical protein [Solwaraspora sp. WMMD406]MDG4764218.1 hypothetical protein [Solwaraspora sp. WMMD406]
MEWDLGGGPISPSYLAIQFAMRLPVIVVLVVALTLLAPRRSALAGRGGGLAIAGCATLLVAVFAGILWSAGLPYLASGGLRASQIGLISATIGGVVTLLDAVGLGLLLAGILVLARHAAGGRPTTGF